MEVIRHPEGSLAESITDLGWSESAKKYLQDDTR
jgi:hypothetical protein